ncbi:MAG: CHAT domain-containing protein, partial [Chloroflexales bacterium]|nr:CHAT domain-containing protein [Chloroflexales bacterium]
SQPQLFAEPPLRDAWQRARALADGAVLPLRLRLRLAAAAGDLHALRWEALRDPLTDVPLACDERLRLVRYLDSADTRPISLGPRPELRALLVVAAPRDLDAYGLAEIDVEGEVGRVRKALGAIPLTVVGDHEEAVSRRATLGAVQAALREGPAILCLLCHGTQTDDGTTLWLEDDDGKACRVSGVDFGQLLAQLARPPLLAALIACDSGGALAALGSRLALAGVGAVVAMQARLSMGAAKLLLPALFSELARDGCIDRAVSVGRAVLRDGNEWSTPALWLRIREGRLWREDMSDDPLDAALTLLAAMPLERIPDPAPLPHGSRMPFARNPLFVGREGDLQALAAKLKREGSTVTITGIGGIGKTNLATEFAHRYGQFFAGGVFWLSFADPAGVSGEIVACGGAEALGLYGEADGLSREEQVAHVLRAWQEPTPRLIVLDNCEDEELLATWCPRIGGGCRVLLTSRSSQWDGALGVVARRLGVLAYAESIALLHSLRESLSDAEADRIADVLGDLPLALHLAGSFLRAYPQEQPGTYLERLQSALLKHPSLMGRGSRHSTTPSSTRTAPPPSTPTRAAPSSAAPSSWAPTPCAAAAWTWPASGRPRPASPATPTRCSTWPRSPTPCPSRSPTPWRAAPGAPAPRCRPRCSSPATCPPRTSRSSPPSSPGSGAPTSSATARRCFGSGSPARSSSPSTSPPPRRWCSTSAAPPGPMAPLAASA